MNDRYRFGIEEEYFLADARTGRSPTGAAADRFHAAAGEAVASVSHELLKGQLEVCTAPGLDLDAAHRSLHEKRAKLAAIAAAENLVLFAAGSHPLAETSAQRTTEMARYRRLEREFGILAHRMMVCAMHVHVEVPEPATRIPLMNRLMPFLPLFLALSTGSPFWEGKESGLKGFRLSAFSEWPRMGLPELFADAQGFARYVDLLVAAKAIKDASFVWWLVRPSVRYPTIELRICDSCTRLDDAVAIAALYRCLVRALDRDASLNAGVGPLERAVTAENIWHAQRDGIAARLIDTRGSVAISPAEALDGALALVEEDAAALDCTRWIGATRDIVRRGSSADDQLAVFATAKAAGRTEDEALRAVVERLGTVTVAT